MEQIVIQIRDKEKAKALRELLAALDFVDSVRTSTAEETNTKASAEDESSDFFSLAGLWQNEAVTPESIRQKAWPRQYP